MLDWSERPSERGALYRPVKQQITIRLDADIVAWFKRNAHGRPWLSDRHQPRAPQSCAAHQEVASYCA